MAKKHFINYYSAEVKKSNSSESLTFEQCELEDNTKGLFEIIKLFISSHKTERSNSEDQTAYWFSDLVLKPQSEEMYSLFHKGGFGPKGTLYNVRSGEKDDITEYHAAVYPFYIYLSIPNNSIKGLIGFHNRGNEGCKTIFNKELGTFLKERNANFTVKLQSLAYQINVQKQKPRIKKIEVVRYVSKTNNEMVLTNDPTPEEIKTSYIVWIPKDITNLVDIEELLSSPAPGDLIAGKITSLISIPQEKANNKYNVTVDIDGAQRTLRVHRNLELSYAVDISSGLSERLNPNIEQIHAAASDSIKLTQMKILGYSKVDDGNT